MKPLNKLFTGFAFVIAIFFANAEAAHAQERVQLRLGYNTGMPVGSFKDFMGKNSFRGFQAELAYPVNERLRIGLGVAYNDYYEKHPRQVYETKDGTISAVVTNTIQTTPILIKANYDLLKDAAITPYVGAGAGFNFIQYSHYLGEFSDAKNAFKPALSADAGVNIPFNKIIRASGVNIGVNYNFMPFKYEGLKNLNNWGIHAGIYFPLR